MSTYRLPAALGGAEVTGKVIRTGIAVGVGSNPVLLVELDGVGEISVPLSALTEVKPPLPPEPTADGTFVTVESEGLKVYAYSRRAAVRASMHPDLLPEYRWWWHDNGDWVTWAQVCGEGDPVAQVADPAAYAEALPALIGNSGSHLTVRRDSSAGDALVIGNVGLSQNEIRRLYAICARALKPGAERDELHRRAAEVSA